MSISRRNFIKAATLFIPVVGGAYYINKINYNDLIIDTINRRLHYLLLDDKDVVNFASDYSEGYKKSRTKITSIDLAITVHNVFPWIDKLNTRVKTFEDYIVVVFLNSSDFFLNGADESQQVSYLGLGFSTPYEGVCKNPFAVYDLD